MTSRRKDNDDRPRMKVKPLQLASMGLLVAAVVKELRMPPEERTWNGIVAGFVPYDLRPPTLDRVRERLWAPDDERIVMPQVFGVGWTVNVGRLVALFQQRRQEGSAP